MLSHLEMYDAIVASLTQLHFQDTLFNPTSGGISPTVLYTKIHYECAPTFGSSAHGEQVLLLRPDFNHPPHSDHPEWTYFPAPIAVWKTMRGREVVLMSMRDDNLLRDVINLQQDHDEEDGFNTSRVFNHLAMGQVKNDLISQRAIEAQYKNIGKRLAPLNWAQAMENHSGMSVDGLLAGQIQTQFSLRKSHR
jgi:hypothetical protein